MALFFTRPQYRFFADLSVELNLTEEQISELVNALGRDNPQFKPGRFAHRRHWRLTSKGYEQWHEKQSL